MSLARNAAFNLAGALLPAAVALLSVPVLVHHLGSSQYGVLVLVTSIVGYFAILDINVTAGSVKYIAEHQARGEHDLVNQVFTFSSLLYLAIGLVGCVLLLAFAPLLAGSVFKVPPEAVDESVRALRWAGIAFLLGQIQFYLQSVPQALQRYDITGKLDATFGTLVSVASMAIAVAGGGLVGIMVVRVVLSAINLAALVGLLRRLLPQLRMARPTRRVMGALGSFSAFSYLSRLAAISASNTDKLFIGAMVDMRSLAMYAVPFVLANRVFALAFKLAQVMMPKASALASQGRLAELRDVYLLATRYVVYVNACLAFLLAVFSPELLRYWAGKEFGGLAVTVMVLVVVGVFIDSLTNLPSLVNDGLGHPGTSGVAALIRAAVGMAAAWAGVKYFGIVGAAVAGLVVSALASSLFNSYVHGRTVPVAHVDVLRHGLLRSWPVLLPMLLLGLLAAIGRPLLPLPAFAAALLVANLALAAIGWWHIMLPQHRVAVAGRVRQWLPKTQP